MTEANKIAIILMLVPGCEIGLDRLIKATLANSNGTDVFVIMDGKVKYDFPKEIGILCAPPGKYGIVRPTKWAVSNLTRYKWILRLTWDAEMIRPIDFVLDERQIYGELRKSNCWKIKRDLVAMGTVPDDGPILYADGYAILAHKSWWMSCYCKLPQRVKHFRDEAVSCAYSAQNGWTVVNVPLAIHRHKEWRNTV